MITFLSFCVFQLLLSLLLLVLHVLPQVWCNKCGRGQETHAFAQQANQKCCVRNEFSICVCMLLFQSLQNEQKQWQFIHIKYTRVPTLNERSTLSILHKLNYLVRRGCVQWHKNKLWKLLCFSKKISFFPVCGSFFFSLFFPLCFGERKKNKKVSLNVVKKDNKILKRDS